MTNDNYKPIEMVYVGRRTHMVDFGKFELYHGFYHMDIKVGTGFELGHYCEFKTHTKGSMVGQIQRVDWNGDATYRITSAEHVGYWPHTDEIAAWRTRDFSDNLEYRNHKKFKDKDYLAEILLPLRREYQKMKGNNQTAFELKVLKALAKRPTDREIGEEK